MKQLLCILFSVFVATSGLAQLPNKAKKLVGKWQYTSGSGFEVWRMNQNQLEGEAYRIGKNGDTSKVETLIMKKVNKTMVYILQTNSYDGDSVVVQKNSFIGTGNKMIFHNIETNIPSQISYSFGCLNKNKLKIHIQFGVNEKPIVLELKRYKAPKS